MPNHTSHRRIGAIAAAALLAAGTLTGASASASAGRQASAAPGADAILSLSTVYDDLDSVVVRDGTTTAFSGSFGAEIITGRFRDAEGGDAIAYATGPGADYLLHLSPSDAGVAITKTPLTIGGSYRPVAGDFDGNGIDDVLWYTAEGRDYLWRFDAAGDHTSTPITVDGAFRPYPLDANGDGIEDILWYGPGSKPDRLWLFASDASHTVRNLSISGEYQVVIGPFGQAAAGQPTDRVVFSSATGDDWIWSFDTAGVPTSSRLPRLDGNYTPLGGQFVDGASGSLFFYGPGPLEDQLWAFGSSPTDVTRLAAPQVTQTYRPITGDFDGNGLTDIGWIGDRNGNRLWTFRPGGTVTGTKLALALRPWWSTATVEMN